MSDKLKFRVEIDIDTANRESELAMYEQRFGCPIVWGEWRLEDVIGTDGYRFRAWIRDGVEGECSH